MLSYPEEVGFFIDFNPTNFQFGIQSDVILKLPKNEKLDLISKLEIGLDEKGYNIGILLDLEGEWSQPLGIPGIVLEQVALKFGIDAVGEVIGCLLYVLVVLLLNSSQAKDGKICL